MKGAWEVKWQEGGEFKVKRFASETSARKFYKAAVKDDEKSEPALWRWDWYRQSMYLVEWADQ